MKVYIDCGAYNGDTLDCEKLFDFKADYKIAFEPNPVFSNILGLSDLNEMHNAIVWTENKIVEFSVDIGDPPYGSTIMPSKKTWHRGTKIEAHAIDFAEFLKDLRSRVEATEVLVKMDIEGAEFEVLDHLHKTGADKLISKIYVEFHENKIDEFDARDKERLIRELGCEVIEWH